MRYKRRSRKSVVTIATRLQAGLGTGYFSPLGSVRTDPGTHPDFSSVGTNRGSLYGARSWPLPSGNESKNVCVCVELLPSSLVCSYGVNRDDFAFLQRIVVHIPKGLAFKNSVFCSHNAAIIPLCGIRWLLLYPRRRGFTARYELDL